VEKRFEEFEVKYFDSVDCTKCRKLIQWWTIVAWPDVT